MTWGLTIVIFLNTFIQIFPKNVKFEETFKADDILAPIMGLSGRVLAVLVKNRGSEYSMIEV